MSFAFTSLSTERVFCVHRVLAKENISHVEIPSRRLIRASSKCRTSKVNRKTIVEINTEINAGFTFLSKGIFFYGPIALAIPAHNCKTWH